MKNTRPRNPAVSQLLHPRPRQMMLLAPMDQHRPPEPNHPIVSVAEKKGTKMAAKWSPAQRAVWSEPFPPLRVLSWNGPQAVKGAPLLGAAQRTLDGEDRSEMITEEGKAGRTFGEKWSAILVPSPAASNKTTLIRNHVTGRVETLQGSFLNFKWESS